MFKRSFLTILFLAAAVLSVNAQNFEGRVTFEVTAQNQQAQKIEYYIKGENTRIEVPGAGERAAVLHQKGVRTVTILLPEQKSYMEWTEGSDISRLEGETAGGPGRTGDLGIENLNRTGETREIQGYRAEKLEYKSGKQHVEAWVTNELGDFVFFANPVVSSDIQPEWERTFRGEGHFPLMVTVKDGGGRETVKFEVTSIQEVPLEESMFEIPDGYNKVQLPVHGEGEMRTE
jgi:hypothetical protein